MPAASRNQAKDAEALASLLYALHQRGLAIGIDDIGRVQRAFRQAQGWSRARRIRALSSLLARTEEERRVIEQLGNYLFIQAEDDGETPQQGQADNSLAPDPFAEDKRRSNESLEKDPRRSPIASFRRRYPFIKWAALCLAIALAAGIGDTDTSHEAAHSTVEEIVPASSPTLAHDLPAVLDVVEPPPPPRLPFLVGFLAFFAFSVSVAARHVRANREELNLLRLERSIGPRCYYPDLPAERRGRTLDAQAIRDAAFYLSRPAMKAESSRLDGEATVDATTRHAGRLSLRWITWHEHRPVVLIEDVSPSMAKWPDFAGQMKAELLRQGSVVHLLMNGDPSRLSHDRDLSTILRPDEVKACVAGAVVVVVSDCVRFESLSERRHRPSRDILGDAAWLHPSDQAHWGSGAWFISRSFRMEAMTARGFRRLCTGRRPLGTVVPRWRPPRIASPYSECLSALRTALGEDAFWWLAAGAVASRIGALNTRVWWALATEGVAPVRQEHADRVWALSEISVGARGAIDFDPSFRDALIQALCTQQAKLLSDVVAWLGRILDTDLVQTTSCSLANIELRATRARLLLIDPATRHEGRKRTRALARDGLGSWVEADAGDDERAARKGISLQRTTRPGRWLTWLASLSLLIAFSSATLLVPGVARSLFPPSPDFRALTAEPYTITPRSPLRFYDRHSLGPVEVSVASERASLILMPEGGAAAARPYVWQIDWDQSGMIAGPTGNAFSLRVRYKGGSHETRWTVNRTPDSTPSASGPAVGLAVSAPLSNDTNGATPGASPVTTPGAVTAPGHGLPSAATVRSHASPLPVQSGRCRAAPACVADGRCEQRGEECRAGSVEDCAKSTACHSLGRCTLEDGKCMVGTDSDCRASELCRYGRCTARAGECVVATDADCKVRPDGICIAAGKCKARNGQCVVSDEACDKSDACRVAGKCQFAGANCVAGSDAHCEASEACTLYHRCTEEDGRCVDAKETVCRQHPDCRAAGKCTRNKGSCIAASSADCRVSSLCKASGRCVAEEGSCVADADGDCQSSTACSASGMCAAVGGACVATSDERCHSSTQCRSSGLCSAYDGQCAARSNDDCQESKACTDQGACLASAGACVAGTAAGCKASAACKDNGLCAPKGGHCAAETDTDCRASLNCGRWGKCTADSGRCVASAISDCRASTACTVEGACSLEGGQCRATDDEDCMKSQGCPKSGKCTARGGICGAASDADCRKAAVCSQLGKCRANFPYCVQ
jgi:hypothetical protein